MADKSASQRISIRSVLHNRWSTVLRLLFTCCPAAVEWLIVPFVVNPLDCVQTARCWTHVRHEDHEVVPPLAYRYSTASVSSVPFPFRIHAPLSHAQPAVVLEPPDGTLNRQSMRGNGVEMKTSTRFVLATSEVGPKGHRGLATLTLTNPRELLAAFWTLGHNRQASELSSSEVDFSHGNSVAAQPAFYKVISH